MGCLKDLERITYSATDFHDATAAKMGHIAKAHKVTHIRYIKADGNSFYRAFMYAYMEKVLLRGPVALSLFCDL